MKRTIGIITLLAVGLILGACAGPKTILSPKFEEVRTSHHVLAILPFQVSIDAKKLPKDYTLDMANEAEQNEGYNMQRELYTRFLDRQVKGKYTVEFQDVEKTNALLAKAGVTYQRLGEFTKTELKEILGVDAVISGSIYRERPMSTGLAVGLGVLFGVWGNTNKVNVTVNIYDGSTGDLMWKYDHEASGSVGSSSEKLAESLMKNISKKFPYKAPEA